MYIYLFMNERVEKKIFLLFGIDAHADAEASWTNEQENGA